MYYCYVGWSRSDPERLGYTILFRILLTYDLLYLPSEICDIFKHVDDNTLGCGENIIDVTSKLEHATDIMLNWFNSNLTNFTTLFLARNILMK